MIFAFFATIVFGIIAILISVDNDKNKKVHFLEIAFLKAKIRSLTQFLDILEKTKFLSNTDVVIDLLMGSLRSLFLYSLAASMVLKDRKIIFKAYAEEPLTSNYLESVKKSMLSSVSQLSNYSFDSIDEQLFGVSLNNTNSNNQTFSSSFHIPIVVSGKVAALIHLSSIKPNLYKYKDMEILYQIAEKIGQSLTRFREVIDAERDIFISLINGLEDGVFLVDSKNNIWIYNNAFTRIIDFGLATVNMPNLIRVVPFDIVSAINDCIINKKSIAVKSVLVKEKILNFYINPLENQRACVVVHDATDEEKISKQKEEFMHVMIHELRAPISTIKDASELLISMVDTLEKDKKLKFLEIIHNQSKSILDQVGSILDTAKIEAGKFTIEKVEGDLARLIKDEIESFLPAAERRRITISYNILNPLPLIAFDPIRISQVLNNLISNSLKFTPEGGKVIVEADYKTIPLNLASPLAQKGSFMGYEKYVIVAISDNGIGIDKEEQKQLFSKYQQAKNVKGEISRKSTGLGLYLVKGIIEAHNGYIWIRSAPTKGTTITFALPAHLPEKETSQDYSQNQTSSFRQKAN